MNDMSEIDRYLNMEVLNVRLNGLIIGELFFNQENEMIKGCYKMNWFQR